MSTSGIQFQAGESSRTELLQVRHVNEKDLQGQLIFHFKACLHQLFDQLIPTIILLMPTKKNQQQHSK